ncbi:carbohydrate-binding protein [Kribbella hippodromi]|uniref:Carbohydrate-binding protein n=1 Tax=Kribbella hippodromi TaxID=434347 RepID=A0ABN2C7Z7_9ACTN
MRSVHAQTSLLANGPATPIPGFLIQSSKQVPDDAAVTKPGFPTNGWLPVAARTTVLAGLLAHGKYPDPYFSTNMKSIDKEQFTVPWWYRSNLDLTDTSKRTYLDFSGILSRADVWVNGNLVADKNQIAGTYTHHDLDITDLVHKGSNAIAFKIYPNNPNRDLTIGWLDWVQTPPDRNMGMVRDILVRRSGPVALRGAHVVTKLTVPSLDRAALTAKVDVRNDSAAPVRTTVHGQVAGVPISKTVDLAAKEKKTVTFDTVELRRPKVWWPAQLGKQPMYSLTLTASVTGQSSVAARSSDVAQSSFGVREVTSTLTSAGGRLYSINGKPLLIRGAGYNAEIFLRWDQQYVQDKLNYVKDLGLNAIRLEGHLEPDEFFEMTDRMGLLVMPGWECCDKWEGQVHSGGESGERWVEADYPIAKASMTGEAERLRDHPSVFTFLIGSDWAPNERIEKNYLDALAAADWQTPVIASASGRKSPQLGSGGMKMNGPYDWIPPNYWYDKAHSDSGGAWGFNSETSGGPGIPTMDTLNRFLTPAELEILWKDPTAAQYHRSSSSTFNNFKLFGNALAGRYGAPKNLDDYVRKSHLAQYENVRAEFESHARNFTDATNPSTGLIYWQLNSGWTSLNWQLFDVYLDQNGAYYGAKKANEPLHIQYSYDDQSVAVINQTPKAANGLKATVKVYNLDGTEKFSQTTKVSVPGGGGKATALTIPAIEGLSTTYLAKLVLTDPAGRELSRNVYWLSTKPDTLDWSKTDWWYTPTTSYADLSGLSDLAPATVRADNLQTVRTGYSVTTTVTLKNTSTGKTPAFFVDTDIVDNAGKPVLPVRWTDNAATLWPGESITLKATYRASDLGTSTPSIRITAWNTPTQTIPAN